MPIDWQWAQLHLIKELRRPSPFFSWAAQLHKAKAQLAPPDGSPNGDMEDMLLKDVADIDKVIKHYKCVYIYSYKSRNDTHWHTQDYTIHHWIAHHEVCIHSYLNLPLFMQHAIACYNRMCDPTQLVVKCVCRICPPPPVPKIYVHRSAREMLSTAHVISCHPGSFKGNDKASRATKASWFPRHLFETCFLELFDVNMKTLPNSLDTMSTSYAIETSGPGAAFPNFTRHAKLSKWSKWFCLSWCHQADCDSTKDTPVVIDGAWCCWASLQRPSLPRPEG